MQAGSGIDLVDPSLFNSKDGHVTWANGARAGYYYGSKYAFVNDPQCDPANGSVAAAYSQPSFPSPVAVNLPSLCGQGLRALALADDTSQIVFQHATPGVKGNLDPNTSTGPGRWSMDMAISKDITIKEGKSINFRMDINNIFNHATPSGADAMSGGSPGSYDQRTYRISNPTSDINSFSSPFGYIAYKAGHRVFSAKLRFTF